MSSYSQPCSPMMASHSHRWNASCITLACRRPYSPERIDELLEEIRQRMDGWMEVYRTSQLPATLFGVLIDAYQTGMRVMDGKVRDVSIYSIPIHRAGHRP